MTAVFSAITGLGCVAALIATRLDARRAYAVSKAVASLGFIGTALAAGALAAVWSSVVLAGLVLAAAGDVALAVRGKRGFLIGLSCFAAAYSVYVAAFVLYGTGGLTLVVTALAGALVAGGAWLTFRRGIPEPMRVPVAVYLLILATMLATGTAAGIEQRAWPLATGVVLVTLSDIAVGRERFGTHDFANKLFGLPAYYAGQTLIALSLAGV